MQMFAVEKVIMKISKVLIGLCSIAIFVMMILISLEVVLRYGFHTSLIWPFEVVEFILVGITFLGLSYIQSTGQHLKVDFIYEKLPLSMKHLARIIGTFGTLLLFVLVTKTGWDYTWLAWTEHLRSWTVTRMAMWPVRLTIPLGGFFMCLCLVFQLLHHVASFIKREKIE